MEALAREPSNVIISMAVSSSLANLMVSLTLRQRILAAEPLKAAAQAALKAGLEAHKDDEALQAETARVLHFLGGGAAVPAAVPVPVPAEGEAVDKVADATRTSPCQRPTVTSPLHYRYITVRARGPQPLRHIFKMAHPVHEATYLQEAPTVLPLILCNPACPRSGRCLRWLVRALGGGEAA